MVSVCKISEMLRERKETFENKQPKEMPPPSLPPPPSVSQNSLNQ